MTPKPDSAPVSSAATGRPNVSLKARFLSWLKTLKADPTHLWEGRLVTMITTTPSTYDTQAADFLARFNLAVNIDLRAPETCPPWGGDDFRKGQPSRSSCPRCGSTHGREYLVTVHQDGGGLSAPGDTHALSGQRLRRPLSFAFWGAHADRPGQGRPRTLWEVEQAKRNNKGKHPSAYDVLACLSSDASCPTTADEVVAEFGDMNPSRAESIAAHTRMVRDWFSPDELSALQEIS